jgi:hypothetical protein
MTLAAGTRLGAYEITAKLGEGGMGEVWRATDSKLKREVAIKVLPEAFAADTDRLARFEREAEEAGAPSPGSRPGTAPGRPGAPRCVLRGTGPGRRGRPVAARGPVALTPHAEGRGTARAGCR